MPRTKAKVTRDRLRHDVRAYTERPLTDQELRIADLPVVLDLEDEDLDYDAIYGKRGAPPPLGAKLFRPRPCK
jgi:hypothetical protein